MSHTCIARQNRPNIHTGDNNLRDGLLKGPNIWPVSDRALPCLPTHVVFDLYFANSLFKPTTMTVAAAGGAFCVACTTMPSHPRTMSGLQKACRLLSELSGMQQQPHPMSDLPNLWRLVYDVAVAAIRLLT